MKTRATVGQDSKMGLSPCWRAQSLALLGVSEKNAMELGVPRTRWVSEDNESTLRVD